MSSRSKKRKSKPRSDVERPNMMRPVRHAENLRAICSQVRKEEENKKAQEIYDNYCLSAARKGETSVEISYICDTKVVEELEAMGLTVELHKEEVKPCTCGYIETCPCCDPPRYTTISWPIE